MILNAGKNRTTLGADIAVLLAVYTISRLIYRGAGGRFDASELDSFWHFIPLDLLKERLWESLFYSHFQPPLYNLYLGVTAQLFEDRAPLGFALGYWALGAVGLAASYTLLRALGVERRIALVITALFWVSPATLLFESFLFYTLPLAVALVVAALLLHAALVRQRAVLWGAFFAVLAAIVLARTLFHPLWLVAVCAAACWAMRSAWRRVLAGAALPLLVVLAVCSKNWVLFDAFGTTTWLGLGLARMTVKQLPEAERERWIAQGRLSELSRISPPGTVADYRALVPATGPAGVPLLDRETKPGGALNLHHLVYVDVSKRLRADALVVLRERPGVYLDTAKNAFGRFLGPASSWHPLAGNRRAIASYADAYNAVFHFGGLFGRSGLMLFLLPGVTAWAIWWARRRARGEPQRLVVVFIASTIAYVTAVGCLLEPNENMRFRFMIEPLLWTLVGVLVSDGVRWWGLRRATTSVAVSRRVPSSP